jgi:hypothetical protein
LNMVLATYDALVARGARNFMPPIPFRWPIACLPTR